MGEYVNFQSLTIGYKSGRDSLRYDVSISSSISRKFIHHFNKNSVVYGKRLLYKMTKIWRIFQKIVAVAYFANFLNYFRLYHWNRMKYVTFSYYFRDPNKNPNKKQKFLQKNEIFDFLVFTGILKYSVLGGSRLKDLPKIWKKFRESSFGYYLRIKGWVHRNLKIRKLRGTLVCND